MIELYTISPYVRKKFVLLLTKELIKNSETQEIKEWKEEFKAHPERKPITSETPKKVAKTILKARGKLLQRTRPIFKKVLKPQHRGMPPVLRIPETRLPTHLREIKPVPSQYPISLGKLDPLLNNPSIRVIECNGPDQNVVVRSPQTKQTEIQLTKQEIDSILGGISKTTGIPLNEGVNKMVLGSLTISAIVSEVIGSKFIIKKGAAPPKRTIR